MDDLAHLFSAYFYEAWDDYEYDSWEQAVDDFAQRSPGRVEGATSQLQELLARDLDDGELDARLRTAGCTYVPDEGNRVWLADVLDRLRSQAAGTHTLSRAN